MSELEWCTSKAGHDWHILSENRRERKSRCKYCGTTNVEKMNGPLVIVSMCVYREPILAIPRDDAPPIEVSAKERLFVATSDAVFERCDDGVFRECRFEKSPG